MRRPILPYDPKLKPLARHLRKHMTLSEVLLWQRLKQGQMIDYDFDRQRPIDTYIVDFFCKDVMLAIEIDGSSHEVEGRYVLDRQRQQRLEALGIRFLRFRDEDIKKDLERVVEQIHGWLVENGS
jgi:very-short-patch-repair endonuclease